ncbi:MAG: hypothetical protein HYY03_10235 [Chloroflexi bacterium]|nr:hypothetical protein [Chloroflexota bacterium]
MFLLAGVLATAGLLLVIAGGPIGFIAILLVASAAVLAAGLAREILAFLSPGTEGSRRHRVGVEESANPDARPDREDVHLAK